MRQDSSQFASALLLSSRAGGWDVSTPPDANPDELPEMLLWGSGPFRNFGMFRLKGFGPVSFVFLSRAGDHGWAEAQEIFRSQQLRRHPVLCIAEAWAWSQSGGILPQGVKHVGDMGIQGLGFRV